MLAEHGNAGWLVVERADVSFIGLAGEIA